MSGLWISRIVLLPFLGWNTVTDLKRRQISLISLFLFGIPGAACLFFGPMRRVLTGEPESALLLLVGICPGLCLLLLSAATGGAIGSGDGLVCVILGLYLGVWKLLVVLMGGFMLGGAVGLFLLLSKKANRKTSLPFLPFLLGSYLLLLLFSLSESGL